MTPETRRKELSRLMMQPNGLELVMKVYGEVVGHFPPANLTPRQIIDAVVKCEFEPEKCHERERGL